MMKRAGINDLSNIVRVKKLKLAEGIYYCYQQTSQKVRLCCENLMEAGEEDVLATNITGRSTKDASQLEWCSQSGQ